MERIVKYVEVANERETLKIIISFYVLSATHPCERVTNHLLRKFQMHFIPNFSIFSILGNS